MAVPMKNGGISAGRVIFYVVLSGITTGIGAFFGAIVGGISQNIIAICLAFAAGAMGAIGSPLLAGGTAGAWLVKAIASGKKK